MNKKTMLHRLRNSYNISEVEMRDARLQAASELERFYSIEEKKITPEQKARDLLERMEVPNAQEFSAGDLVELANLFDK